MSHSRGRHKNQRSHENCSVRSRSKPEVAAVVASTPHKSTRNVAA